MAESRALAVLAVLAVAAQPGLAAAAIVVLGQPEVPQYAEAAAAFHKVRPESAVNAADAAAVDAAFARAPDVVVAIGPRALEIARRRAGGAVVVAAGVLAPEPGDRLTAVPMEPRAQEALAALAALAPEVKRVVALHPPGARAILQDARAAARAAGLQVEFRELGDLADFQGAFRRATEGAQAVWLLPDPRLARPEVVKFMVTTCLERRVPLVGFVDGMTRIGALLSVSADFPAIGREAARLAAELEARPPDARHEVPLRLVAGKLSVNERVREMLRLPGRPPAGADVYR